VFKRLTAAATVLLLVFGLVAPTSASETSDETEFLRLVNDLRTSQGLNELVTDSQLTQLARSWTSSLATTAELSHSPDLAVGLTQSWTKLGENVGVSPEGEIERLFEAFVNSPSHYANLVDPNYDAIGIAVAYRDGRMWTTHRFMSVADDTTVGTQSSESVQRFAGSTPPNTAVLSSILSDLSQL